MESFKIVFRGLLLGFGFSIGALLIYSCYRLYVEIPSQMIVREKLIAEMEVAINKLSGEVIDYKLNKGRILVNSKIKNNGSRAQIYVAPKIEFFDSADQFLFNCRGKPVQLLKAGEEAFFNMECQVLDSDKLTRVDRVRVKPVANSND